MELPCVIHARDLMALHRHHCLRCMYKIECMLFFSSPSVSKRFETCFPKLQFSREVYRSKQNPVTCQLILPNDCSLCDEKERSCAMKKSAVEELVDKDLARWRQFSVSHLEHRAQRITASHSLGHVLLFTRPLHAWRRKRGRGIPCRDRAGVPTPDENCKGPRRFIGDVLTAACGSAHCKKKKDGFGKPEQTHPRGTDDYEPVSERRRTRADI